jgi:hypothetical protein
MTDSRNDIGAPFPQRKEQTHDDLCRYPTFPMTGPDACDCDLIAKVRADQDDRECDHCTDLARLKIADLRAKVKAMPRVMLADTSRYYEVVDRAAVLALFDGSSE